MSISDDIRSLAGEGLSVSEIARRLGIRYQHAYGVLKAAAKLPESTSRIAKTTDTPSRAAKPPLSTRELMQGGFELSGRWVLSDTGDIKIDCRPPASPGVYAFAKNGTVLYVGVATIGLAKRLYFYSKPGPTQPTNQRLNEIIKRELLSSTSIDVYTAVPPDLEWNGLPVHGSAGLELGLIRKYALPWNKRSAE